jgi:perosamine synthetase
MEKIHMAGPWMTELEYETVGKAMRDWYDKPYWYVEEFQREFAAYHGRKYALMTPNCTTSIHLLLTALGIGPGDEVIVPECTWIASVAPVVYLKATPIFTDIDPVTWCLDPAAVERSITPKTKAIIVVDLFGNMPKMKELEEIAQRHGLHFIEDSAESLGSTYQGTKAGKFGVGSVFSFHRTKTLVTGEGGMLILDDKALYDRCTVLRDHGRRPGGPMYFNDEVTYKYMPFNVQAAIGYAQLQRLADLVGRKRWMFNQYKRKLADVPDLQFNHDPAGDINSVWITGLVFGTSHKITKADAIARLEEVGVPVRPFFYPLSHIPAFAGMEAIYKPRNPVAYDISSRGINLPGAMIMTEDQIDFVCDGIRKVLGFAPIPAELRATEPGTSGVDLT